MQSKAQNSTSTTRPRKSAAVSFLLLSQRLRRELEGVTAAELEWQQALGMNTIGMLLAHNAIVEVLWSQVGVRGEAVDTMAVLGLDDHAGDGMPLPPGAPAPASLAGKP